MYCLKHAAELECYDQGGPTKPRCTQPECGGGHATGAHKLLGEADASVNLVAGEDSDSDENEEWWVNTVRVEEEGEDLEELEDSELEESRGKVDEYCNSACMRKDDSGLEDELEYFRDAPIPSSDSDKREEDRWWSPGPQGLSSGEEDEEEVRYLVNLLGGEPKEGGDGEGVTPPQGGAVAGPSCEGHQASVRGLARGGEGSPRLPCHGESLATKRPRRRKLRKKGTANRDREWEAARHDAWLRELLTDSSEGSPWTSTRGSRSLADG
jgi:hypothetical protein